MYCRDYFAEEIAAEESGQSDSTFYSDTFADPKNDAISRWICPNLTKTTITDNISFEVDVVTCSVA